MNKLKEAIGKAIPVAERRKPKMEVNDDVEKKVKKMADLFLKSPEAKNGLIDSFTDWFEQTGKKQVGLKDDEYSLDDMDVIMGLVGDAFDKVLK